MVVQEVVVVQERHQVVPITQLLLAIKILGMEMDLLLHKDRTFSGPPVGPSPGPSPVTYTIPNTQWVGGGHPGGSGGGTCWCIRKSPSILLSTN